MPGSTVAPSSVPVICLMSTARSAASYTLPAPALTPPTDMVKFTVTGGHGSDTVNFVFIQAGVGARMTLLGTDGKDVIFATGSSDFLTGLGGADQFVFAPASSLNVYHTITDFETPLDKIDLRDFSPAIDLNLLLGPASWAATR